MNSLWLSLPIWRGQRAGERSGNADVDCSVGLGTGRERQEAARPGGVALHIAADAFGHNIRKNSGAICILVRDLQI